MLWNREIVSAKDIFLMIANIWLLRRLDRLNFFFLNHPLRVVSGPEGLAVYFFYYYVAVCLVFLVNVFTMIKISGTSLRAMCFSVHLLK